MANVLSPRMKETLERAAKAGALYRWAGGYWSDKKPPEGAIFPPAGAWIVASVTINALVDRDLLTVLERFTYGTREPRVVKPADGAKS